MKSILWLMVLSFTIVSYGETNQEAALGKRFGELTQSVERKEKTHEEIRPELIDIMKQLLELSEKSKNVDEMASTYASATMFAKSVGDKEFETYVDGKIKGLIGKYPNHPKVIHLEISELTLRQAPPLEVLPVIDRCLKINPKDQSCQLLRSQYLKDYEAPKCLGEDISPRLGLFVAVEKPSQIFTKKMVAGDRTLYIENQSKFDKRDIEFLSVQKGEFGQPEIFVQFSGQGKQKFADVTKKNIGNSIAWVLDDQILSAPVISNTITGGAARITLGATYARDANNFLKKACAKITVTKYKP